MSASIVTSFSRAFRSQFARLPVWLPGTSVEIGDIGVLIEGQWRKVGRIEDKTAPLSVSIGTVATNYELTTSAGVEIGQNLSGDLDLSGVVKGNASLSFDFSKEGAFAFLAGDCTVDQADSLLDLQANLAELAMRGTWDYEHIVVSSVVRAKRAISAVSGSSGGKANLDLGVSPTAGATLLGALSDVGAQAKFGWNRDMAATFVTSQPSVVMFDGWHVKNRVLRGPKISPVKGAKVELVDAPMPFVTPLAEL